MKFVREDMGFTNVKLMIPFCRTEGEAQKVIGIMKRNGLARGVHNLEIYMMVEIPSNALLAEEFAKHFDGFSIGSNDLTQLTFDTTHENYYAGFLDDDIAPKAYAYLLVNEGRATFATCLFKSFSNAHECFDRALKRLHETVDIDIANPKKFGGYINFFFNKSLTKDNRIHYVGENAGFQDALWGFGMRYAMQSGHLAARSIIENISYPDLCKTYIQPKMEASLINRWMFTRIGNKGYAAVLNAFVGKEDVIPILQKRYNISGIRKWGLLPIAKLWFRPRLQDKQCMHENCS